MQRCSGRLGPKRADASIGRAGLHDARALARIDQRRHPEMRKTSKVVVTYVRNGYYRDFLQMTRWSVTGGQFRWQRRTIRQKAACAGASRPATSCACPFLTIAMALQPASICRAVRRLPKPSPGPRRLRRADRRACGTARKGRRRYVPRCRPSLSGQSQRARCCAAAGHAAASPATARAEQ